MEQQLFLKTEISSIPPKTCAFTGHRSLEEDFSLKKLKNTIKFLLEQGVDIFYNGMAIGFDLTAAEILLSFRRKFKFKLIACIPCVEQEKYYPTDKKNLYYKLLKKADEQVVLAEAYYKGCMQIRDKYMAERADVLVAYCNKNTGGTAYTVKCFQRLHPQNDIFFI